MKIPTASSLSRAMACRASVVLPYVHEPSSYAAERGTAIHAFIETALTRGPDVAMSECPEDLEETCRKIDLSIFRPGVEHEVAMGYIPKIGEEWEHVVRYQLTSHRAYPDDGLFHVTVDLVGMLDEQTVWVADIKTGDHEAAADSWQLRLGALAACALTGATCAEVEMLRLNPDGSWKRDRHTLAEGALASANEGLVALMRFIRQHEPGTPVDFKIGDHCKYCPALRMCPGQTALVRAFEADVEPLTVTGMLAALTPEKLAEVYMRTVRYGEILEKVEDSLRAIVAATGPLPLPDGRAVDLISQSRRKVRDGAPVAIAGEFPVLSILSACSLSVSKLTPEMAASLYAKGLLTVEDTKPSLKIIGKKNGKESKA